MNITGNAIKAALASIAIVSLSACGGAHIAGPNQPAETPVAVQAPPDAQQIAAQLGGTRFHDTGPGALAGVTSSGTCWIGGKKYGIDTFPNQRIRDKWLKISEDLGVSPKWETSTSVVYPSVMPPTQETT